MSIRRVLALSLAGAAILAVVAVAARRARERALWRAFERPVEAVHPDPVSYYPTVVYDLHAYESAPEVKPDESTVPDLAKRRDAPRHEWADGAGKEEMEKKIQSRTAMDGVTAATRIVRLCTPSVYRARRPSRSLCIVSPPDSAIFPPNLCAPCIEWEDAANNAWQVTIRVEGAERRWTAVTEERRWWIPPATWEEILRDGVERNLTVEVKGVTWNGGLWGGAPRVGTRPTVHVSEPSRFRISRDPADRFVVYRLVCPPFSTLKTPDTFVRDISSYRTRMFLSARRSYCFNCHTFSSTAGTSGKLSIQSRYMMPGPESFRTYFAIYDFDAKQGRKIALPFDIQMTTFMAWSPDGTRLALSANQQISAFEPIVFETQSAGEPTSDVAVYDVGRNAVRLLPGASDPDRLELFPRWTPDGKEIVFCRAATGFHPEMVKYDLCRIPFNDGKGGNAAPVPGASNNLRSNYYPRFSPDGRWFSFCQSDGGELIKSSSDIYLMKGDLTGPARRLECNAEFAADSWHSWSSNGRWIVFASKRDGILARLYLTHIDDEGRASPAIRLPLRDDPMESFNIPEFVQNDPAVSESDLYNVVHAAGRPMEAKEEPGPP